MLAHRKARASSGLRKGQEDVLDPAKGTLILSGWWVKVDEERSIIQLKFNSFGA
jgi:hypothetical protein